MQEVLLPACADVTGRRRERALRPERSWIKHSQTATPRLIVGKAAFYCDNHRGVQHLWGWEYFFHATRREALNVKCEEEQTESKPSAAVSSVQGQVKCWLQFVGGGSVFRNQEQVVWAGSGVEKQTESFFSFQRSHFKSQFTNNVI